MRNAVLNWSGGKDAALALQKILHEGDYNIIALLTTFESSAGHSSMHLLPYSLLKKQAESIGIPLYPIYLSKKAGAYEEEMRKAITHFKKSGVTHFIFGDIFLSDVKSYRESKLNPLGIEVIEPLWGRTSEEVMQEFLNSGIQAKVIVTQADKLDSSFIGREIDQEFCKRLPPEADICGENGEYHTLAYKGGIFRKEIPFTISGVSKISHDFKMNDGQIKRYEYWQAEMGEE